MGINEALAALRSEPRFSGNVTHWERVPARSARHAPFPAPFNPALVGALARRGIEALYSHQAAAVDAALRGENVAAVTPAASGKTLCYNLPTLHRLLADPRARALYLFPTKALAQDQLAELRALTGSLGPLDVPLTAAAYDGDTPPAQRSRIRDGTQVILTNPDMLHGGILPQHPRWAAFFSALRVVVIDEMHVYRGVFGSHVANVLRRLRRICAFYGNRPQFILASATIANPADLAERLVEAPVTVVGPEQDGAPHGEQHFLFYNPPLIDADLGIRRSSSTEAADLAALFLAHDVQTIVFARARLTTELILTHLRANAPRGRRSAQTIRGYRGGYLASERRAIEEGLRLGTVRGVVATSALELGIDIGRLDAAVLSGYPGTVASARQQMGRAGRRQGTSAAVLVAGPNALDQYLATHPAWLLGASPEHARLNADNEIILAGHLACAAAEMPLRIAEPGQALTSNQTLLGELAEDLVEAGQLYRSGDRLYWGGQGNPAASLGLRSAGSDRVVIHTTGEGEGPRIIGELDRASVPQLLYEGAIYLHEGATYVVEKLDWEAGAAYVRPVAVDYYTRPAIGERIDVLQVRAEVERSQPSGAPISKLSWGDVRVVRQATGYRILRRETGEPLGFGPIDLPEQSMETQGCWLAVPEAVVEMLRAAGAWHSDANEYGAEWPDVRASVRARDGYRCQGCGAVETPGQQHDVHHKIPFRAFLARPELRGGLPAEGSREAANRLENLVTLCRSCHRRAEASVRIRSGLGGAAALLAGVAPLTLMCDPADLGVYAEPQDPVTSLPTVTLYESTPGGVGYAEQLFASMPDLLRAALAVVETCPCRQGCPGCVGPVLDHDYALDAKELAIALIRALV